MRSGPMRISSDLFPIPPEDAKIPTIRDVDERLFWVLPERDGGLPTKDFNALVQQQAERAVASSSAAAQEHIPSLEELDPTQRTFVELGMMWQAGRVTHFRALLLGTAGSGKTTTLKTLLKELQQ